ncbi:MAG: hypothetical protein RR565_09480 [Erysipelothrix sp.]
MNKGYSVKDFAMNLKGNDVTSFINNQSHRFTERFGLSFSDTVQVTLRFEDAHDAQEFYNELRYNQTYSLDYTVTTSRFNACELIVDGAETLYDYFGSREPNLLTVSRDLKLNFEIIYNQEYTGIEFTGMVHRGELLSRQCVVEVASVIPELSLGGLSKIAREASEFDDLLTRCYIVKGTPLL